MRAVAPRFVLLALFPMILLASGGASARNVAATTTPVSHGLAIRVTVPGGAGSAAGAVTAPKDGVAMGGAFAYPADGSVVRVSSVTASAFTVPVGAKLSASASSEAAGVTLFNGEITASTATAKVRAEASATNSTGSQVAGLTVLGAGVAAGPGARFNLGDWGYLATLTQAGSPTSKAGAKGYVISQAALLVHLNLDHGGLPAGSEILIGYADAQAEAAPPPPKPKATPRAVGKPAPPDDRARPEKEQPEKGTAEPGKLPPLLPVPKGLDVRLTSGGYVFPIYGPTAFGDSFGAGRADTGWHHGEDLFAPLGAPILAVTDGTVFSVGWNDIGGLRVWLRDRHGNEFYYAHLSAFSQLAVNGNQVEAGDVLGFVGNTGDAEHTPYHLHFEIHPVGRLYLGYDGAVDPTAYLTAWEHLQDLRFDASSGWTPLLPQGAIAPKAAAILLQASDISTPSGLDPDSLQRALAPAASEGDGSLLRSRG